MFIGNKMLEDKSLGRYLQAQNIISSECKRIGKLWDFWEQSVNWMGSKRIAGT